MAGKAKFKALARLAALHAKVRTLTDDDVATALQQTGADTVQVPPEPAHATQQQQVTQATQQQQTKTSKQGCDVFISYSWKEQTIVKEIHAKLVERGVTVWIDLERMQDDILTDMAEAIEGSKLVLICMSEGYRNSDNCKMEALYTHFLKKDFIPLLLQEGYRPNSWLGILQGGKLYYDFSGHRRFQDEMENLLRAIRRKLDGFSTTPR